MNLFIKGVEWLSRLLGYVAAILLVVAVIIVCQMVYTRFVMNLATSWQTEFVTYCLLASTFLGAPWVLLTKGHVNVELVPLLLKGKARFALALFATSSATALCMALAWYSFEFWHEAWEGGWTSDTIWAPDLWKAYLSMPIGFFAISLQYLSDLLCLISGREPPFGIPPDESFTHHIVEAD